MPSVKIKASALLSINKALSDLDGAEHAFVAPDGSEKVTKLPFKIPFQTALNIAANKLEAEKILGAYVSSRNDIVKRYSNGGLAIDIADKPAMAAATAEIAELDASELDFDYTPLDFESLKGDDKSPNRIPPSVYAALMPFRKG